MPVSRFPHPSLVALLCLVAALSAAVAPSRAAAFPMDRDEAAKVVRELEETKSGWMGVRRDHVLRRTARAYLLEAAASLEDALAQDPAPFDTAFLLARAWAMLNGLGEKDSYSRAAAAFRHAMELRPRDQESRLYFALFLRDAGKMESAERAYWDALWLGRELPAPDLLDGLATTYLYQGNGLWAYWAARGHLAHYPLDRQAAWIRDMAENYVHEDVRRAIRIHFSPDGIIYAHTRLCFAHRILPGWYVRGERHARREPITSDGVIFRLPVDGPEPGPDKPRCTLEVRAVRKVCERDAAAMARGLVDHWHTEPVRVLEEGAGTIVFEREEKGWLTRERTEAFHSGDVAYLLHLRAVPEAWDQALAEYARWRPGFRYGPEACAAPEEGPDAPGE